MRNKIWIFIALLPLLLACKSQKLVEQDNNYKPLEKALLWEITGNELEEHSYLFGTIHLITKEDFFWPKGTLAALDDAESVVFEIDMDDMFNISTQMSLLPKAFMKDGLTLKDFYSEEDYKLVRNHFQDMGIPLFFLERIKPMFLTVFASGDIEFGAGFGGDSPMRSYEMEIFELSQESSKNVGGLETIEFQMSMFDSIPYQAQADMLLETIKSSDADNVSFQQMVDKYTQQDINWMVTGLEEEDYMAYEDLLLVQRNKNWIPLMSEMMKNQQVFFAVGAGHLGGETGVIHLLRQAGYTVTPISQIQ